MHGVPFSVVQFLGCPEVAVCCFLREMPPAWSAYLWLAIFIATGWGLGVTYEFLHLYAGPAEDRTFLLCALGYPAMTLAILANVSAVNQGRWSARGLRPGEGYDRSLAPNEVDLEQVHQSTSQCHIG